LRPPVRRPPPVPRTRDLAAEGHGDVTHGLREVLYICCMAASILCAIAAVTIAVAFLANRLQDSQAWMAAVFFAAVGVAVWIAGRAARF
jgi:hypothetical protein